MKVSDWVLKDIEKADRMGGKGKKKLKFVEEKHVRQIQTGRQTFVFPFQETVDLLGLWEVASLVGRIRHPG